MERALGQFFVDVHTTEHGYTEVAPPLLVRDDVMFGTAQLPKFEEDQFLATSSRRLGSCGSTRGSIAVVVKLRLSARSATMALTK